MLKVKRVSIYKIKDEWNQLLTNRKDVSPFQEYEYVRKTLKSYRYYPYWRNFPIFFGIYRETKLICIAPLCFRFVPGRSFYTTFGARFRICYEDFIYDEGMTKDELKECVEALEKKLKRMISVRFISEDSLMYQVMKDNYEEYRLEPCVMVNISNSYDEYLTSLSAKSRSNMKRGYRDIEKIDWEIKYYSKDNKMNKSEYKKVLDVYIDRYNTKWSDKYNGFGKVYNNFFLKYRHPNALCINSLDSGYSAVMYINGEVAAIASGYVQKDNNYIIFSRGAVNNKFIKYQPGKILYYEIIKKYSEESNIKFLDLSKGTEEYKFYLGGRLYYQHCFKVVPKK